MRRGAGVYASCRSNRHPSGGVFVQTVNAAETISTFDQLEAAVGTGGTYTLTAYIDLEADLILTDITLNSRSGYDVGIFTNGHKLTMQDGVTLDGVYIGVDEGGQFNMNGGRITGNEDMAVMVEGGTFTMANDSKITGNQCSAVWVSDGTFKMMGGEISGNQNYDGGGVFLFGGTFMMEGGTISGNTAVGLDEISGLGGGVYVSGGTFTMTGGTIAGNQAGFGAGVCISASDKNISLSGNDLRIEDPVLLFPSISLSGELKPGGEEEEEEEEGEKVTIEMLMVLDVAGLNLPADCPILLEFPDILLSDLEKYGITEEAYIEKLLNESIQTITDANRHMFRLVFTEGGVVTERYSPVRGADGKWTYGPEITVQPEEPSEPSEPETEEEELVYIPSEPIPDGLHEYSLGTMLYRDGKRVRGITESEGAAYYFDRSGWMQTGWVELEDGWRYFGEDGKMVTGWLKLGNVWYYLDPETGLMLNDGLHTIGKSTYYFYGWGGMANDWWYEDENGDWYFFGGSGAMKAASWVEWKGEWYYLTETGKMAV